MHSLLRSLYNRLGIVIDAAHATMKLVEAAAKASKTPLILSHTAVTRGQPAEFSRRDPQDRRRQLRARVQPIGKSRLEHSVPGWSHAVEAARPSPADVMCDRDGRWQRPLGRIVGAGGGARHHLPDLIAAEPARLGDLLGVDRDLLGQGLGEKPNHEARRKGPRLRSQIANAPAPDARFLAHLAAHGLLQGFTRLDEAGEA